MTWKNISSFVPFNCRTRLFIEERSDSLHTPVGTSIELEGLLVTLFKLAISNKGLSERVPLALFS